MRKVHEWIDWASERFQEAQLHYGHGTDNARDEAAWLVMHALGVSLQSAFSQWDLVPEPQIAEKIEFLVEKRIQTRVPAAYLTGTAWFAGLEFEVNTDVLVPRSPLAELIGDEFEPWLNSRSPERILDIGTGSGCIAIACAARFPGARVDAADISEAALEVAQRNVDRHAMQGRVRIVHSDLFDSLEQQKYDLIVSNPPYVPKRAVGALPAEYRAEPELGLVSRLDGLEIPLRILKDAAQYLAPGGVLVCEVGESHERLQEALPRTPFIWLEFEAGGHGVFLLEQEQVVEAGVAAESVLRKKMNVA